MVKRSVIASLAMAAWLAAPIAATAQSQAARTGVGGTGTDPDATSLLSNPLVIGTAVAAAIGAALAFTSADNSAVATSTSTIAPTTTR